MRAVALNMFGVETVDYALALARFIDKPSSVLSRDGRTVLVAHGKTTRLPSGTIKKSQFIYRVVNKWVELYEIRQIWLNVPKVDEEPEARCATNTTFYFPDISYATAKLQTRNCRPLNARASVMC